MRFQRKLHLSQSGYRKTCFSAYRCFSVDKNSKYTPAACIAKACLFIFPFLFVFYVSPVFAQKPILNKISQIKINIKTAPTPKYKLKNYPNNVTSTPKWLVIELEYIPLINRKNKLSSFNFNNSFDIKFEAIVLKANIKSIFLLSTTVSYWPISFDGKKHYELALIPFSILNKITQQKKDNKFLKEMIKIKATFYFNKTVIGQAYYPHTKTSVRLFSAADSSLEITRLAGMIFNRNQTPWLLIDPDKYELIK
jgi:hypothetical protein